MQNADTIPGYMHARVAWTDLLRETKPLSQFCRGVCFLGRARLLAERNLYARSDLFNKLVPVLDSCKHMQTIPWIFRTIEYLHACGWVRM